MKEPIVLKCDFKSKNPVRGLALTCDQRYALFNMTKQICYFDVRADMINKAAKHDKLKAGTNFLPSKIDQNQHFSLECSPLNPRIISSISNQQTSASAIAN